MKSNQLQPTPFAIVRNVLVGYSKHNHRPSVVHVEIDPFGHLAARDGEEQGRKRGEGGLLAPQHVAHNHMAHSAQRTAHSAQCTVHHTPHTVHRIQYTVYSTQHTAHRTPHTPHTAHTAHSTQGRLSSPHLATCDGEEHCAPPAVARALEVAEGDRCFDDVGCLDEEELSFENGGAVVQSQCERETCTLNID